MDGEFLLDRITKGLLNLPGEAAHGEAMPLNRPYTSTALRESMDYRESAVSVILYKENDSLKCILIQRPEYDGTHSNQIAFPGGKRDPEDINLTHTAIRECYEEISVLLHLDNLIGKLTPVFIPVSSFLVQPFVFFVDGRPDTIPEEREVAEIIHFDLAQLLKADVMKLQDMKFKDGLIRKNIPYYSIENKVVWGATAMMLAEIRAILT